MDKTNIIQCKNVIPDTHFFIYRNNKYPFKFDYFKYASKYFTQNEEELLKTKNINLLDNETENKLAITDQTIKDFINFVQSKKISVNNENVFHLNYLSNIYEVITLSEKTSEYISNHQEDLVLQILEAHQNDVKFETTTYEDIISKNIEKYLKDERLLNIKIPILYRIIKKYNSVNNKKDKIRKQMNEFLLKVLKKFGRSASVLFENYEFGETKEEMILLLIKEYSNIFDFQYICSEMIKTIIYIEEQKNKNQNSFDQILASKNSDINELKKQNQELKYQNENLSKSFDEKEKEYLDQIAKQKQNSDQILASKNSDINQLKKQNQELKNQNENLSKSFDEKEKEYLDQIAKQKQNSDQIISLKNSENQNLLQQIKDLLSQNEKLSETIKIKDQEQNKENLLLNSSVLLLYNGNNEFNGIIKYLTNKTGGNIHKNKTISVSSNEYYLEAPENLLDFNENSYFYTMRINDAWICFDFKDIKVKITNYSIKSISERPNTHHLKSWKIEVSNDGQKWIQIDEQKNCSALNGDRLSATFKTKPNDFSRYVKLSQTDETWGGNEYRLAFFYLEFYGYIKE